MKKIYVLLGLGSMLLTAGVLARVYAYPALAVVPEDTEATVVARSIEGAPATYFSIAEMAEMTGSLTNVTRVRASSERTAAAREETGRDVVAFETYVCTDPTNPSGAAGPAGGEDCRTNRLPLSGELSRYAIDEQTGELVAWSESSKESGGEVVEDVPFAGYIIKLPFNARKASYAMWNGTLQETVTAEYVGETEVAGVRAFEYEMTVPPTMVGELDLPGSLVGSEEPSVTADRVYSSSGTMLVEPETGLIIGGTSSQDTYAELDGERVLTITQGEFAVSDDDIAAGAKDAQATAASLHLLRVTIPLAGTGTGALLLVAAGVLLWRRRRNSPRRAPVERASLSMQPA